MHGRSPWRMFFDINEGGSIFRGVDRIRIMKTTLDAVFSLEVMRNMGLLTVFYPLHNPVSTRPLAIEWANWNRICSPAVPLVKVKDYFGEVSAFRLCHLTFQCRFILPLAVAGPILLGLNQLPCKATVMMVTSAVLMLWSATYNELWKQTEARWRMLWGMEDWHQSERVRPEFKGEWDRSEIDRYTYVKKDTRRSFRRALTVLLTMFFIGLVVVTTMALYYYEAQLQASGHLHATTLLNVAIALQMRLYAFLWQHLSVWLTDFDNYELDSEYFTALVIRVFCFQFINSFVSLFYVAFFKHIWVGCLDITSCSSELAYQLRILFVVNLVFHGLSMAIPYFSFRHRLANEDKVPRESTDAMEDQNLLEGQAMSLNNLGQDGLYQNGQTQERHMMSHSYQEAQAKQPAYLLTDEVWERIDVIFELGYVLFFGFAAPDIITLFLISNLARLRALGWILVYAVQRPYPRASSGIGHVFTGLYQFMCRAAVLCNLLLLIYYNAQGPAEGDFFLPLKSALVSSQLAERHLDWKSMLVVLMVLNGAIYLCQEAIDCFIPDLPRDVLLESKRRKLIDTNFSDMMFNVQEGHALSAAYSKLLPESKKVNARGTKRGSEWVPTKAEDASRGKNLLPWDPADPWFQDVWFRTSKDR